MTASRTAVLFFPFQMTKMNNSSISINSCLLNFKNKLLIVSGMKWCTVNIKQWVRRSFYSRSPEYAVLPWGTGVSPPETFYKSSCEMVHFLAFWVHLSCESQRNESSQDYESQGINSIKHCMRSILNSVAIKPKCLWSKAY